MSPATGRRYPLTMICEVWSIARSTVYQAEERGNDESREPKKRGPKTELSDEALVEEIRQGTRGERLPRRGAPEGEGTAAAQGDLGGQEQGAEAHAREPTPGAGA